MKKRLLGSLLVALFVVGLMAPAALAGVNGVAVFPAGTAEVGEAFGPDGCPKSGDTEVTGKGLGLPTPDEMKNYGYHLKQTFVFAGTNNQGVPDVYTGEFEVCGMLTAPFNLKPPLGATCVSTKGHHGRGYAFGVAPSGRLDLKVYNLNWKAAGLGLLVITGNYQVYDGEDQQTKKDKPVGDIVALVNASPSEADPLGCLNNAQKAFTVNGTAELIQGGVDASKGDDPWGPKKCPEGTHDDQCEPGDLK